MSDKIEAIRSAYADHTSWPNDDIRTLLAEIDRLNDHITMLSDDDLKTRTIFDQEKAIQRLREELAQAKKPMTNEQIAQIVESMMVAPERKISFSASLRDFARAIERAHGIGKESSDE